MSDSILVLDTNVLSESVKPSPSAVVAAWMSAQPPRNLYTTVISQIELLMGARVLPPGRRQQEILQINENILGDFDDRILPFTEGAARSYIDITLARKRAGRPIAQFDAMIAAIALSRHATLATRNAADFDGTGVRVVDPWSYE